MKHIVLTILLILIVGIAGADSITAFSDATMDIDGSVGTLTGLTYDGTTYTSAQLVLGTTTRFYLSTDGNTYPWLPEGSAQPADYTEFASSGGLKQWDVGSHADDFKLTGGNNTLNGGISSIDNLPYMECIFDAPTSAIFYFERGGTYDVGNIYGITDGVLGNAIALTSAAYTGTQWAVSGNARAYVVEFDTPVDGMRIAATGADAFIITTIPEPASMMLLGLGGLALLRRRKG